MKKSLGFVLLAALTLVGCAGYKVIDQPSAPLSSFGKVDVGPFTIVNYMNTLKGTDRYDKYLPVATEANQIIAEGVRSRLAELPHSGGPALHISGDMQSFATGSGAMRGLAAFGLVPGGVGNGVIEYLFTVYSGNKRVATFTVRREISGGAQGAYQALAKTAVQFIKDKQ